MKDDIDLNIPKKWLRIFLTVIPLVAVIYSIFWVISVTQPIFLNAVGIDCTIVGSSLIVSSIFSSALAIYGLKNYETIGEPKFAFFIYVCCTLICFLLLISTLMYTSVSSQGIYEFFINLFITSKAAVSASTDFDKDYLSQYDKMKYFFLIGNNSHDFYMVISVIWVVCFCAYFIITDTFEVRKEKAD